MKDELHIQRKEIKIRKSWPENFSPETKVEKPKTDYKRSQNKSEIQKALEQEAIDNADLDIDWLP